MKELEGAVNNGRSSSISSGSREEGSRLVHNCGKDGLS